MTNKRFFNSLNKVVSGENTISSHPTLLTGLLSYYKCDTSGSFPDVHGNNDGTLYGPTYTASGKINGAYDYDGINDYTLISNQLNISSEFSIKKNIKFDSLADSQGIFSKRGNSTNDWQISISSSGDLNFLVWHSGGAYAHDTYPASNLNTVDWFEVVFTYKAGGYLKLYVNGIKVGTDVSVANPANNNNIATRIGDDWYDNYLDAKVDEIGVWTKELTQAEITDLYNSGNGLPYN